MEECDFLYLLRETELNKGKLSSHLAKLEEAGYVGIEKGRGETRAVTLTTRPASISFSPAPGSGGLDVGGNGRG